jgi:hypothetical protein
MNRIFETRKPEEIKKELDDLDAKYKCILRDYERVTADLDGYTFGGYERWKNGVLEAERSKLAHDGVHIDPNDAARLNQNKGAYDALTKLMTKKADLEFSHRQLDLERIKILNQINDLQGKLNTALKKQEAKA